MIPRSRTTAGNGSPRRRNTLSLAGLGALLTVVGPRSLVVQSFVVPRGVTRFDASAAAAGFCVASLPNRAATINTIDTSISHNKRYSGRSDRLLLRQTWAVRGFVKTALGASLDDDTKDNFDPDVWKDFVGEDDDMGLGVSKTIKNKKPRRRKPEEVEGGRENVIFDIATGAQQLADAQLPDDEFDKYKRKEPVKEEEGEEGGDEATAEKRGASMDGGDEDDLGMGVSTTVKPTASKETYLRDESLRSLVIKMQEPNEVKDAEKKSARNTRRAKMIEDGMSPEQIAAYLGGDIPTAPKSKADLIAERTMEFYKKRAFEDPLAWRAEDALLKVAPSSSLVKLDEKGEPLQDRFVYVDEYTCIGCTHCSHEASATFFMEEDFGRARVFQQGRDTEEAVRTAISTCPVDCIHYVDWPELKDLEAEREGIEINFKAKLVGNDHDNARNGQQLISGNKGMRCENCPSRGCYDCPMFSVGNNPEYAKRKAEKKMTREAKMQKEKEERSGKIRRAEL